MSHEQAELNFQSEQLLMESGASILNQEFRVTDEYGNPVWLLTTKAPIRDGQGGVMGLVGINRNVTEIKRAEERLTHIITGASCLLWYAVVEEHGEQYSWDIFVSDEQAAQRFLPLDLGSRQTYAEAWQSNVHPDDRITMDALSAEKISSVADGYNQDYRCYRNDSEIRWLHEVVQIKQLTPGRYVLVGVCTDVTDSKLASETLQRANEMLEQRVEERTADLQQEIGERIRAEQAERDQRMLAEALADVSLAISETLDIDETLDRILTHTAQTVPSFTAAGVMLIEDDAYVRFLRYRVQKDGRIENAEGQKRFAINDMPELQQILENDEPVVVNDTRNKVIWIGKQAGVGEINSFIGIPIHAEGKIIGFLTIGSDNPNQFNKAHANRLLAFSNQAGVAIQNARLFREAQSLAGDLQKRVEERTAELDNERAQLHTILDAMTEGVIYYDVDGKIRYINRSLIQLTGYDADDWLSARDRWPENLLDEANQRNITQSIQRTLFKDGIWQTDLQLNRKDGERIDVKLVMTLVTGFDGNSAGAVTVLRDVSADKRLEAQKARFIATASHELRTPLTNLKTRLYLLNKQPERINDHLDVIVSETDRMKFLVDELLDVSRFEHGLINLNYEDFVLQDLIRLILRVQFPRAEEKSINLQESLPETPLTISADRLRIEQVITNLITNAISYTPENGEVAVTVTVEEQNEIGKRFAAIQVRDTGIGIPEDVLPDIFQPFFRVNDFQSGMGLGLSISKEIVEMHGGKITVESEINMGACFTVYLQLDVERDS
jgi:two-component system phosphate regulon sensor histidine kinase PhoR